MTPEFIKSVDNALTLTKNIMTRAGEEAIKRGLTISALFEQEGSNLQDELTTIKNTIDSIPEGLDKRLIDDSYQELLDLIANYDIKQ